jgi:C4-dicarboxylate-specific signal transduction histidine kinase
MVKYNEILQYSKHLSVLYAEDDKHLQKATSEILRYFFEEFEVANDGMEALEKFKKRKEENDNFFDLIITDLNMPHKDGINMLKEILEINPEQHAIIISAHNDSSRLIKLIDLGVEHFLMKPLDINKLTRTILKTSKKIYLEKKKEQFIIDQSKLASMGEMMDSIAHQWLQPIQIMKMSTEILNIHNNDEANISKEDIKNFIDKNLTQINHLTQTLNEFRGFFKPNENLTITTYKKIVDSVMLLLKDFIKLNTVQINTDIKDDNPIEILPNEFKHVVINIICNAIDAFNDNDIKDRTINISTKKEDEDICLLIKDNAGGIPKDVIGKIFESNFTTKETGSGVGLYLSSKIINKVNGEIKVANENNGACFTISLKSVY